MRHGWLKIPGVQTGDRAVEDQVLALKPAISECTGKTVLDIGCAEGLIGFEFAKAGAARVLGIDAKEEHLRVARKACRGYVIKFKYSDLNKANPDQPMAFDIVLALGVIHKLVLPWIGMRFSARSAKNLLLLRSGRGAADGIITGKRSGKTCDSHAIMREEGFMLEKVVPGPAHIQEDVEYWRKTG